MDFLFKFCTKKAYYEKKMNPKFHAPVTSANPFKIYYLMNMLSLNSIISFLGAESIHSDEALLPDVGYTPSTKNNKKSR